MAQINDGVVQARSAQAANTSTLSVAELPSQLVDKEKVLPLPEWLKKLYFIFPVILYIPDIIFNYFVYSDGWKTNPNPVLQVLQSILVGFLSVGIVGMAYLLSVLAPWHWGQGHHVQAVFCAIGVIVATAITTWNSLAYRSLGFVTFQTDEWVWSAFPDLKAANISITMILVAVAPPFWGLFWAVVQPTETGRTLRQLQESHAERLMRMQQEAELKKLRAETNAKIREAQLRGMAATAAAARDQASGLLAQGRKKQEDGRDQSDDDTAQGTDPSVSGEAQGNFVAASADEAHKVLSLPVHQPQREVVNSRKSFMNSAAPAAPSMRVAPADGSQPLAAQPMLMDTADIQGNFGMPASDTSDWTRQPPSFAFGDASDVDAMTGTTGPRAAVRRPFEPSPLMRNMNERVRPEWVEAYKAAMRELDPSGRRKTVPSGLAALVAEKLNVDESSARTIIGRVRESQRESQRSGRS
ncbi:MAG TPA: hypothetical protein VGP82_04430 [Ktedonobacterales bacterium]|jgi:hypothetical protein|nr:hypothetical protein [Ktedonobacterales bacterium]